MYTGYFERQQAAHCGLHALNNAIGFDFLTTEDMTTACDVFLDEMAMELSPEERCDHELPTGWYSEAVMAQALRVKDNIYRLNLDDPVQPAEEQVMRIFGDNVLGMTVNVEQRHWVAVRIADGRLWLLDSEQAPVQLSVLQLLDYVATYRHAFLVELIAQ